MPRRSRRRVLRLGVGVGVAGLAGCNSLLGTTDADTDADTDDDTGESDAESTGSYPPLLTRPLPNPERHVDELRNRAEYDRELGTVRIDSADGTLEVHGPGEDRFATEIVTVAGYLDADGIEPGDSWGGVVDPADSYVGTNATWHYDRLHFDPGQFRGVALRAVPGLTLVVDDETVAEDRGTVRYTMREGVRNTA